jgi:hypothetical protein
MAHSARGLIPAVLLIALTACVGQERTPVPASGVDRSEAWADAMTYQEFMAGDTANLALWTELGRRGAPADVVARARQTAGSWKLLVVAESWCSDAVYSVPFLAALADSVAGLELRLLRVEGNEALFQGHERNGRAAHPLILVLDGAGRDRGGWVERPAELASWIDARRGILPDDDLRLYRRGWYEGNGGRTAMTEILDLLDDAIAGRAPVPPAAPLAAEEREVTPCPAP